MCNMNIMKIYLEIQVCGVFGSNCSSAVVQISLDVWGVWSQEPVLYGVGNCGLDDVSRGSKDLIHCNFINLQIRKKLTNFKQYNVNLIL